MIFCLQKLVLFQNAEYVILLQGADSVYFLLRSLFFCFVNRSNFYSCFEADFYFCSEVDFVVFFEGADFKFYFYFFHVGADFVISATGVVPGGKLYRFKFQM